jgi:adenosine deaminase
MIQLAIDNDCCYHICLTSNELTGVVDDYQRWHGKNQHPVTHLVEAGAQITIGTDDPIQCNTDLDSEFRKLRMYLRGSGMSDAEALKVIDKAKHVAEVRTGLTSGRVVDK